MTIRRINLPAISFIVARSYPQQIIGCENQLPWHLRSDLQFFKRITSNNTVIMGRKTFESIGKPLPNRKNIVISRRDMKSNHDVDWVQDAETAIYLADVYSILHDRKEVFVVGGGQVYKELENYFTKIYLTEVFVDNLDGDAFFNYKFNKNQWKTLEEKEYSKSEFDDHAFRISILKRKDKTVRTLNVSNFLKGAEEKNIWLSELDKSFIVKKSEEINDSKEQIELLDMV